MLDTIEWSDMPDVAELFEGIGFPPPGKAPLMPLDHQVTQKLHAVSGAGDRARDLVDLQLIMHRSEVDLVATRRICERLFSYRKAQEWPPIVSKKAGWDELYAEQASDLPVLDDVDSANRLGQRSHRSHRECKMMHHRRTEPKKGS